jgi:hypothetical protein
MTNLFFDDSSVRRPIRLSSPIAQGAAGTIHHVIGEPGIVAKLYKDPKDLVEYQEKIAAMLAAPPNLQAFAYGGRTYVQIAWPIARVSDGRGDFLGFVMPEVDFTESTELENILQRSARQRKQLPEFYGARVLLAANLAALTAELHALGHYMIDMKPMNMRFYSRASYMAILDTDGFSINGVRRLPARQFSDEYIAPEARGKKPEQLGLEQDRFALAVIIFRLLNNGIHPYQGVDAGNHPTNLQERIFAGLYAYGLTAHRSVGPALPSIHQYFEGNTRALFDEAFQAKTSRPTAEEWRDHLNGLITNKILVKCRINPKDHAHFSMGCGLCALEQRMAGARAAASRIASTRSAPIQSSGNVLNTLSTAPATHGHMAQARPLHSGAQYATSKTSRPFSLRKLVRPLVVVTGLLGLYIYFSAPRAPNPTVTPNPSPSPPVQNFKILNAVLASSIEGGKPKGTTRIFKGPNAPIALYFDYQDARPNYDLVGIMVSHESENFYPCERTKLLYVNGSIDCKWTSTRIGNGKVTVSRNGLFVQDLAFNVVSDSARPERAPLDIRPEAQILSAPTSIEEDGIQDGRVAALPSSGSIAKDLSGGLSTQECSAKYIAAKNAGTLNDRKWNDFRKTECEGSSITPGGAVFPSVIAPQHSGETPGKARMLTCVDQYNANKSSNANGGMKWVEAGGGYYNECNKRLKS